MKTRFPFYFIAATLVFFASSCSPDKDIEVGTEDYHAAVDKVTEIMVHDIFSPPVASRIYAYPNIAAYEILAQSDEGLPSLAGRLRELGPTPQPEDTTNLNAELAALMAHMELSKALIFSEDDMQRYQDSLFSVWSNTNKKQFEVSQAYAMQVTEHIKQWMDGDFYKQTRTMPKFSVNTDDPSRWQPTPPAYMDGIEPHWSKIRPFAIDSAAQFKPAAPPPFSLEENSDFYKELKEVYDISNEITSRGDESEEIAIARFWDCNPYVSVVRGHLMLATKKITPGAHWIGITKIAARKTNADYTKTVTAYTQTSVAIFDAFISCWDEKYRSNLIRPETLINQHIDDSWEPVLQTPPFPEYTSGHSVVSGAAAIALTDVFGENFAFEDDTELAFGLPVRSFPSFKAAAQEAAISRMYGGIHYRAAVEIGVNQGQDLGKLVVAKLAIPKQ